jgi:hypothetical protein
MSMDGSTVLEHPRRTRRCLDEVRAAEHDHDEHADRDEPDAAVRAAVDDGRDRDGEDEQCADVPGDRQRGDEAPLAEVRGVGRADPDGPEDEPDGERPDVGERPDADGDVGARCGADPGGARRTPDGACGADSVGEREPRADEEQDPGGGQRRPVRGPHHAEGDDGLDRDARRDDEDGSGDRVLQAEQADDGQTGDDGDGDEDDPGPHAARRPGGDEGGGDEPDRGDDERGHRRRGPALHRCGEAGARWRGGGHRAASAVA